MSDFAYTAADFQAGEVSDAGSGSPAARSQFQYYQGTPQTVWTIQHNLNSYPPIVVIDSAGHLVDGDFLYLDANNVMLTFYLAFSGTAYL